MPIPKQSEALCHLYCIAFFTIIYNICLASDLFHYWVKYVFSLKKGSVLMDVTFSKTGFAVSTH